MKLRDLFEADKDPVPSEDVHLADQKPTTQEPQEVNAPSSGSDDKPDDGKEDVGSVSEKEGFVKSKKKMFAFGKTRPVTLLTKNEKLGGLDITYQYVINPKTGAWSLRACLQGQSEDDMVEHSTGEDPSSLIKDLKKSKKITPHWAAENLNPPADKVVNKPDDKESEEKDSKDSKDDDF